MDRNNFFDSEKKLNASGDYNHLLKGALEFYSKNDQYSEEVFRVYQSRKDLSIVYYSEQTIPLPSGEFLNSYLIYKVAQDWYPTEVLINRYMGKAHIEETYKTYKKESLLIYKFSEDGEEQKIKMPLPPKFQISTGHISTAFIFISSKKYDVSGKNYHNLIVSPNQWKYNGPPKMEFILLRRPHPKKIEIQLRGKILKCILYELYKDENFERTKETPAKVWMSSHFNIPYMLESPGKDLKVMIRYLNELEKPNFE